MFYRLSPSWDLPRVFLMIVLGPWDLGRSTTQERVRSHQTIKKICISASVIPVDVHHDHLAWAPQISSPKSNPLIPLQSLEGSHCTQLMWKE